MKDVQEEMHILCNKVLRDSRRMEKKAILLVYKKEYVNIWYQNAVM